MKNRLYLGIDPGASGAWAALTDEGRVAWLDKMPETEDGIVSLCRERLTRDLRPIAMIEQVWSRPQRFKGDDNVWQERRTGGQGAWTLAQTYGACRAALCAFRVPWDTVTPQTWQKALDCLTGGEKRVSKARAQALFPDQHITLATADALLIAEFCRRQHEE